MMLALMILAPVAFIAVVAGLVYALNTGTKRDADRWLVDRRMAQRRHEARSNEPAADPERRHGDRRKGDEQPVV